MNIYIVLIFLGIYIEDCCAREPFKPRDGSLPFVVYFLSRYRGICVGTLVSRTAVLTAAVCVTSHTSGDHDTRPINVVTSTGYRHPRRGIRVQVTKILLPNLSNVTGQREYLMQKSVAVMILKRKVPDALSEIPMRSVHVDYLGEEILSLQEECFMPGWHFFYRGDTIYPIHKFLLQRNARVQFLNIVKKTMYCEALSIKFQKALTNVGFSGYYDRSSGICIRDPDRTAQPCHGMYGAPLLCRGKVVAVLLAPDAQWTNCTGFSNIVHLLNSKYLSSYMACVSRLFSTEHNVDWALMKESIYDDEKLPHYDYIPAIYDRLMFNRDSSSSSAEST